MVVKIFGFLVYLLLGLLLVNSSFSFIGFLDFPSFRSWLMLIGGVFLIAGGINYLRANRAVQQV